MHNERQHRPPSLRARTGIPQKGGGRSAFAALGRPHCAAHEAGTPVMDRTQPALAGTVANEDRLLRIGQGRRRATATQAPQVAASSGRGER